MIIIIIIIINRNISHLWYCMWQTCHLLGLLFRAARLGSYKMLVLLARPGSEVNRYTVHIFYVDLMLAIHQQVFRLGDKPITFWSRCWRCRPRAVGFRKTIQFVQFAYGPLARKSKQ